MTYSMTATMTSDKYILLLQPVRTVVVYDRVAIWGPIGDFSFPYRGFLKATADVHCYPPPTVTTVRALLSSSYCNYYLLSPCIVAGSS